MKTFYTILAALIFSVSGYAQQATVTATIAAYAGGSVVANFQRQGGGAPSSMMTSGTLNGSGVFTLSDAWNNAYSGYAPSVTSFTICATNTPATCYSAIVQITSSSQDISTAFAGAPSPGGGGSVSSVFGRTGAVVAAANDYSADQIASGTVTGHGWVCGNGCVWTTASGGFNNANEINGATLPVSAAYLATNSSGQIVASTPILSGTTSAIGGSALLAGACVAGTVTVTGATTSMVSSASPSADPESTLTTGVAIYSFVSSANTITVRVCALVPVTPASVAYNVRVIQ